MKTMRLLAQLNQPTEEEILVMSETKKLDSTTDTELTRFNAVRHGILSRHTVLPWESREEYESVLAALVAEHVPQGPTEEHLVEELAHIMWRKRRLRLAEAAAHRRALGTVLSSLSPFSAEERAVISIPPNSEGEWIEKLSLPPISNPQSSWRSSSRNGKKRKGPWSCFGPLVLMRMTSPLRY